LREIRVYVAVTKVAVAVAVAVDTVAVDTVATVAVAVDEWQWIIDSGSVAVWQMKEWSDLDEY
jgi:hypothetical protein